MKLNELIKNIEPLEVNGDINVEIGGVEIDSRNIEQGYLFIAMRGTQTDGHRYIATAIEKGATAVLCEDLPEDLTKDVTYIKIADSEEACGKVATAFFGNPTKYLKLVGVTGTNGKTTTATLLYDTFRYLGYKAGLDRKSVV